MSRSPKPLGPEAPGSQHVPVPHTAHASALACTHAPPRLRVTSDSDRDGHGSRRRRVLLCLSGRVTVTMTVTVGPRHGPGCHHQVAARHMDKRQGAALRQAASDFKLERDNLNLVITSKLLVVKLKLTKLCHGVSSPGLRAEGSRGEATEKWRGVSYGAR
eukprot:2305240-Rhodomonas_salina.1